MKRKGCFWGLLITLHLLVLIPSAAAKDPRCPGSDDPPPPILKVEITNLTSWLEKLKDAYGGTVWKTTGEDQTALREIFDTVPPKTKLEQFFQLLYLLQENIDRARLPVTVRPPGISELLVAARVFTDPSFPQKITEVVLTEDLPRRPPRYRVDFSKAEVRFPLNGGEGFSVWDQGMCQVAKDLVFYPGFSFRIRKAKNSQNLVVENFQGVEIYGQFGTRKIFSIDLNYVDLEKVEFIRGTDQGKVKSRVAKREFRENKHSRLFRFVGTLIPNTSRQRIDW